SPGPVGDPVSMGSATPSRSSTRSRKTWCRVPTRSRCHRSIATAIHWCVSSFCARARTAAVARHELAYGGAARVASPERLARTGVAKGTRLEGDGGSPITAGSAASGNVLVRFQTHMNADGSRRTAIITPEPPSLSGDPDAKTLEMIELARL